MTAAPALASRDFRRLVAGQFVSLVGTQMNQVAVTWQLYQLTHSAVALGTLGLVRLPVVLFGLGGGVVADAVDRRRLMLASQSVMALCAAMLAAASATGQLSVPVLYGVAFVSGIGSTFDAPARQSLVPLLVPREQLGNALSLHALAWQVASVAGPALGWLVLAHGGATVVYVVDVVSYLAVIGALVRMEHRQAPGERSALSVGAIGEALRFLRGSPLILSTMLLDFAATFFGGSMLLMPIFADQILHTGPRGLGWLYAAQPVGAVLAAVLMSARPVLRRAGPTVLVSVAIYGAAVAGFGASRWLPLSLAMLALSGAADTVSMVIRQTLRQQLTPDAMRGRMTSVNMIFFRGGPQLGEVEAGFVAQAFGARVSVASGGVLCVVAVLAAAALVPTLRRYREPDPVLAPGPTTGG